MARSTSKSNKSANAAPVEKVRAERGASKVSTYREQADGMWYLIVTEPSGSSTLAAYAVHYPTKPAAQKAANRFQKQINKEFLREKAAAEKAEAKAIAAAKKTSAKKLAKKAKKAKKAKRVINIEFAPIKTRMSKSQIAQTLVDETGITRKQAIQSIHTLEQLIFASMCPNSVGRFTLPGVIDIKTKKIPAKKGGKKAINAFTKEEYITKAKPATVRVKARALAKLRDVAI